MKTKLVAALAAATMLIPAVATAHSPWLKPSATVVSGKEGWVTVDAAASTDVFIADHQPLPFEMMKVTQPDGSAGQVENGMRGKFRSTFDVHLTQPGTYRIGSEMAGVFGSYMLDGKEQRLPRGLAADKLKEAIPAGATDVKIMENAGRNVIFVTLGAPTDTVLKPTGKGLDFAPVTHPDDLVAGEPATFGFLVDGKPAAGIEVKVIPDGRRYRDEQKEESFTTDAKGQVKITWPAAGLYWVQASTSDKNSSIPGATDRRMSFTATLEVLQP
ncbi:DUF4198 domain-containing protein [Sphingomonas naphthae]|uniref:DUF4198 domain-containing protein n=1 Tax=Sphingomonas naphthae TaxID=1813468 RepID=A0ABY7TFC4_9SPHN|nr:DUF4198 domain-containing protein [Sphingomonas naphthae]WCT71839.1 DUF4198 domain-containing protein [Sphingomonas naphthae]